MRITVIDHYQDDQQKVFEGTDRDIAKSLYHAFPWLAHHLGLNAGLDVLLTTLSRAQAYSVYKEGGDIILKSTHISAGVGSDVVADMLGHNPDFEDLLAAAAFLAGTEVPEPDTVRRARLQAGDDDEAAALLACGLDDSYRDALHGVVAGLSKSEIEVENNDPLPAPGEIVAATPDGETFAEWTKAAWANNTVFPVRLGGKHSAGSALAFVPEHHVRILLKPGSGPQNPASGDRQDSASQSKREAGFYAAAQVFALTDAVPEVHLLLIDGKEYAAGKLLPFDFKNMNRIKTADLGAPRRLFHMLRPDGTLHRWAAMDLVCGNVDRNAGNVMARGDEVYLIDHGSAFAGDEFDPANDGRTFVPYYLRALAPADFDSMTPGEKLRALPRLNAEQQDVLANWLRGIDATALATALHRFGIDATPAVARLQRLQGALSHQAADVAVLSAWVV